MSYKGYELNIRVLQQLLHELGWVAVYNKPSRAVNRLEFVQFLCMHRTEALLFRTSCFAESVRVAEST